MVHYKTSSRSYMGANKENVLPPIFQEKNILKSICSNLYADEVFSLLSTSWLLYQGVAPIEGLLRQSLWKHGLQPYDRPNIWLQIVRASNRTSKCQTQSLSSTVAHSKERAVKGPTNAHNAETHDTNTMNTTSSETAQSITNGTTSTQSGVSSQNLNTTTTSTEQASQDTVETNTTTTRSESSPNTGNNDAEIVSDVIKSATQQALSELDDRVVECCRKILRWDWAGREQDLREHNNKDMSNKDMSNRNNNQDMQGDGNSNALESWPAFNPYILRTAPGIYGEAYRDTIRTMPENCEFAESSFAMIIPMMQGYSGSTISSPFVPILPALWAVLVGYHTIMCPHIGYCQGINSVAASLLLIAQQSRVEHQQVMRRRKAKEAEDAETAHELLAKQHTQLRDSNLTRSTSSSDAFHTRFMPSHCVHIMDVAFTFEMLSILTTKYGFDDIWRHGLPRLCSLGTILDDAMQKYVPRLHRHIIREANYAPEMLAASWLLPGLSSSLPVHTYARVMDTFLVEGWSVLIRVIIAILQKLEKFMLTLEPSQISTVLREWRDLCARSHISSGQPNRIFKKIRQRTMNHGVRHHTNANTQKMTSKHAQTSNSNTDTTATTVAPSSPSSQLSSSSSSSTTSSIEDEIDLVKLRQILYYSLFDADSLLLQAAQLNYTDKHVRKSEQKYAIQAMTARISHISTNAIDISQSLHSEPSRESRDHTTYTGTNTGHSKFTPGHKDVTIIHNRRLTSLEASLPMSFRERTKDELPLTPALPKFVSKYSFWHYFPVSKTKDHANDSIRSQQWNIENASSIRHSGDSTKLTQPFTDHTLYLETQTSHKHPVKTTSSKSTNNRLNSGMTSSVQSSSVQSSSVQSNSVQPSSVQPSSVQSNSVQSNTFSIPTELRAQHSFFPTNHANYTRNKNSTTINTNRTQFPMKLYDRLHKNKHIKYEYGTEEFDAKHQKSKQSLSSISSNDTSETLYDESVTPNTPDLDTISLNQRQLHGAAKPDNPKHVSIIPSQLESIGVSPSTIQDYYTNQMKLNNHPSRNQIAHTTRLDISEDPGSDTTRPVNNGTRLVDNGTRLVNNGTRLVNNGENTSSTTGTVDTGENHSNTSTRVVDTGESCSTTTRLLDAGDNNSNTLTEFTLDSKLAELCNELNKVETYLMEDIQILMKKAEKVTKDLAHNVANEAACQKQQQDKETYLNILLSKKKELKEKLRTSTMTSISQDSLQTATQLVKSIGTEIRTIDEQVHVASTEWKRAVWLSTLASTQKNETELAAQAIQNQLVAITQNVHRHERQRVLHLWKQLVAHTSG